MMPRSNFIYSHISGTTPKDGLVIPAHSVENKSTAGEMAEQARTAKQTLSVE